MSKQCLDVQQMQHLQELGLDTSNASAFWCNPNRHGDWSLEFTDSCGGKIPQSNEYDEFHPAYTLQDVLDALPNRIYDKGEFYLGCYDIMIDEHDICYAKWCGSEIESTYVEIEIKDNLIDAAYELLVWCIENKFVEKNKNE